MQDDPSQVYDKSVGGDRRELLRPLVFVWPRYAKTLRLPPGTQSDGNSRPGLLRRWFPRWWFDAAAVYFHDHAFDTGTVPLLQEGRLLTLPLTFKEANLLYYDIAMSQATKKQHRLWARLAYAGLQYGGVAWLYWTLLRVLR